MIPAYAANYHTLLAAIEAHLVPLGVTVPQRGDLVGGYFIWLQLPPGVDAAVVAKEAKDEKLSISPGHAFEVPNDPARNVFPNHLRLCFAWEESRQLTEGVRRLARVLLRIGTVRIE